MGVGADIQGDRVKERLSWIVPVLVGFAFMMCAFTVVLVINKWRKERGQKRV